MPEIRLQHTADVSRDALGQIRQLLDVAFEGRFTEHDWDHALGGLHALAWDGDEVIGHGALVQRRLLHQGRALRAGYVEGVAVRADHRRTGVASAIMSELERIARGAYQVAALSAADPGARLYLSRGWLRWTGPTSALTPTGLVATPDEDGSVFVLPITAELDPTGPLTCDWRDGDVW
jgi:aminoglycoside 2'-N-acetyltransferase I